MATPQISDAEWKVMQALWKQSPLTSAQIIERLRPLSDWAPKTIQTLINRLVGKKAVGYESQGRTHQYYPAVSQEECVSAESDSFLQRIFNGAFTPMVAHMVKEQKLSNKEIQELKRILKQADKTD
jgi:BlaI family penicillinase repressor